MSECEVPEWPKCNLIHDDIISDLPISIVGFPDEYGGADLRKIEGYISQLKPKHLSYALTTSKGQSGGPVYVIDGHQTCVVGIHQKGDKSIGTLEINSKTVDVTEENWCIGITAEILNKIEDVKSKKDLEQEINQIFNHFKQKINKQIDEARKHLCMEQVFE